jgi:hypothetical protein
MTIIKDVQGSSALLLPNYLSDCFFDANQACVVRLTYTSASGVCRRFIGV